MKFREWLYLQEDYESYRGEVERRGYGRQFPFKSWFPPESRVFIDMARPQVGSKDIEEFLSDNGYKITDYAKGFARAPDGKVFKIQKVINKHRVQDLKELEARKSYLGPMKYAHEERMHNNYFNGLDEEFSSSRLDVRSTSPYVVAISSNIHDIATMSTDRSWTSCMELGSGGSYKDVYCEVEKGGFVAYLYRKGDPGLKSIPLGGKPLARIHIRRFDNAKGKSVAMPEKTVYGNEIEGFPEAVQRWLISKQGNVRPGRYRRRGGKHSDTFERNQIIAPTTAKQIVGWLKAWKKVEGAEQKRIKPYAISAIESFLYSGKEYGPKVKQWIWDFLKEFTELDPQSNYRKSLARKYPEFMDRDTFDDMAHYRRMEYLKKHGTPEQKQVYGRQVYAKLMSDVDIDNPELKINKKPVHRQDKMSAEEGYDLGAVFDNVDAIERIDPVLAKKMVKFGEGLMGRFKDEMDDEIYRKLHGGPPHSVLSRLVYAFAQHKTDYPVVVEFYKKLLPYWHQMKSLVSFPLALASLGRNGEPFLPFLRKKLAEEEAAEENYKSSKELMIERIKYIIDSIETGKGSSRRYSF